MFEHGLASCGSREPRRNVSNTIAVRQSWDGRDEDVPDHEGELICGREKTEIKNSTNTTVGRKKREAAILSRQIHNDRQHVAGRWVK